MLSTFRELPTPVVRRAVDFIGIGYGKVSNIEESGLERIVGRRSLDSFTQINEP